MTFFSSQICDAFQKTVFSDADILAITPNIYIGRDMAGDQVHTKDLRDIVHHKIINFVQVLCQRYRDDEELGRCGAYKYRVLISYYREEYKDEATQSIIQHFFELLDDKIYELMGRHWCSTVDSFNGEVNFPQIFRAGQIDSRPILVGQYSYFGDRGGAGVG